MPRAKKAQQRLRIDPLRIDLVTVRKANVMAIIATSKPLWAVKLDEAEEFIREYNTFLEGALRNRKDRKKDYIQRLVLTSQDFENAETKDLTEVLPEFMEYLKRHSMPWKENIKTSNIFEVPTAVVKMANALDAVMGVSIGGKRYTVVLELDEALNLHYSAEKLEKMADINRELRQFLKPSLVENLGYTGLYMVAVSLFNTTLGGEGKAAFMIYSGERSWPNITPVAALPKPYAYFYLAIARAGSDYAKPVAGALLRYIRTGDLAELYSIIRNMTQTKRLTAAEKEALQRLLERINEEGY
ncbi:hypothetical protein [Pyrobaculum aerophilum]|uniref:hypothetical protein n=1 Tax=Pyrobaculum aerophilum TaxID=13773 RepID=UPI0023F57703|nr:hypothetical protein [Pyrobaculum aerophilum]MCX8136985.1 hypothetical protein [Pyrobaculum aerophilum]